MESDSAGPWEHVSRPFQRGVPVDQTVATALVRVALHVNALSGGGLGWGGVFIMAIGNGIPIGAVKVRIVTGDLCKVSVGGAA